jgi:hypothetical protein
MEENPPSYPLMSSTLDIRKFEFRDVASVGRRSGSVLVKSMISKRNEASIMRQFATLKKPVSSREF